MIGEACTVESHLLDASSLRLLGDTLANQRGGGDVAEIVESALYLRYVIGRLDPDTHQFFRRVVEAALGDEDELLESA